MMAGGDKTLSGYDDDSDEYTLTFAASIGAALATMAIAGLGALAFLAYQLM
jgi:hypothetical protein